MGNPPWISTRKNRDILICEHHESLKKMGVKTPYIFIFILYLYYIVLYYIISYHIILYNGDIIHMYTYVYTGIRWDSSGLYEFLPFLGTCDVCIYICIMYVYIYVYIEYTYDIQSIYIYNTYIIYIHIVYIYYMHIHV